MAKRQIIPVKFSIVVTSGAGEFNTGVIKGTLRRIVIIAPGGPPAVGRVKLRDEDAGIDIFNNPEVTDVEVALKAFQDTIEIPVNGPYKWMLDDVSRDGTYTGYYILEERPTVL